MRLPRRPVRSLFRFLFSTLREVVAVWLDLGGPAPREETKPRQARRINTEHRRDR